MYMETKFPDLQHTFNTRRKLERFCNSIPDAISYSAKTLFY